MKQEHQIPLIYHPTNVLFLDDEAGYLNRITQLVDEHIPYITMTDPHAALEHLKKHCYQADLFSSLLTCQNFDHLNESESIETFDIDFSKLSNKVNDTERFQKIMVVFVDQMMPKMKGLEFCKRLREASSTVKIILLTGNTEKDDVIEAFNSDVIDAYLPKDHPDIFTKINQSIARYTWEQFIELSQKMLGFINHLMAPLCEKGFLSFFETLWKENKWKEFYLLDSSSSFLLVDEKGHSQLLLMHQEIDFRDCYSVGEDSGAPDSVLAAIKNKKQMPVTNPRSDYLGLEGDEWLGVMHDCIQIEDKNLYYTLVDEPSLTAFGFARYLEEVWSSKS